MDRITSIINRFLILYFVLYFAFLTNPVQTRRSASSSSSNAASSSASSSGSSSTSQISGSCELALRKCSKQIACGMTLHDYRLSCKQVSVHSDLAGYLDEFSKEKLKSLNSVKMNLDLTKLSNADAFTARSSTERAEIVRRSVNWPSPVC